MLVGNVEDLPEPLARTSTAGLMRDEHPRTVERWIDAASAAGLIRVSDDQYRTLSLTTLGRNVMAGRVESVQMAVPVVRHARATRRGSRGRLDANWARIDGSGREARRSQVEPKTRRSDQAAADAKPVEAVVEALRAWRLEEARRRAIAPFVILHERTLIAIATSLPRSMAELHAVPGIGPAKLTAYGDAILAAVASVIATAEA